MYMEVYLKILDVNVAKKAETTDELVSFREINK